MPQISLYVDEDTLKKIEMAAKRQHMSISKWVSQQLKAKIDPVYPPEFEELFGCVREDALHRPDTPGYDIDSKREVL